MSRLLHVDDGRLTTTPSAGSAGSCALHILSHRRETGCLRHWIIQVPNRFLKASFLGLQFDASRYPVMHHPGQCSYQNISDIRSRNPTTPTSSIPVESALQRIRVSAELGDNRYVEAMSRPLEYYLSRGEIHFRYTRPLRPWLRPLPPSQSPPSPK
jgi:hypothetical protein